jgi:mono/diheme cytochrome c family protein
MRNWGAGSALLVAIAVSGASLAGTFGFALVMQRAKFAMQLPSLPPSAQAAAAPINPTGDAAQGKHLFLMNCAHCHADDAHGDEGPDLYDLHKSDARIHEIVTAGIKGEMPSFAKKLNEDDVKAITAFLRTLRS